MDDGSPGLEGVSADGDGGHSTANLFPSLKDADVVDTRSRGTFAGVLFEKMCHRGTAYAATKHAHLGGGSGEGSVGGEEGDRGHGEEEKGGAGERHGSEAELAPDGVEIAKMVDHRR